MTDPAAHEHLQTRSTRIRMVRDVFEIVAFAAAGIWAIWTFWYQASYAPKHELPAVDWKLSLEVVGHKSTGEIAVRAVVRAKNTGKAIEHLAGIIVNVRGLRVAPDTTADPFARIEPTTQSWHEEIGTRRVAHVLLGSDGDRFGDGADLTILPDEDWLWETTFIVPADDYAILEGRMAETSIMGTAKIKREWFSTVRGTDGLQLVATDACRATRDCRVASSFDYTALSLWPANASPTPTAPPAASASPAAFPVPSVP